MILKDCVSFPFVDKRDKWTALQKSDKSFHKSYCNITDKLLERRINSREDETCFEWSTYQTYCLDTYFILVSVWDTEEITTFLFFQWKTCDQQSEISFHLAIQNTLCLQRVILYILEYILQVQSYQTKQMGVSHQRGLNSSSRK